MWASVLLLSPGVWRWCPLSLTVKSTRYCFHCVQKQNPILFSLFLLVSICFFRFLSLYKLLVYWAQWQETSQRKNPNNWVENLSENWCSQTGVLPDGIIQHIGMYTNAEWAHIDLGFESIWLWLWKGVHYWVRSFSHKDWSAGCVSIGVITKVTRAFRSMGKIVSKKRW